MYILYVCGTNETIEMKKEKNIDENKVKNHEMLVIK